MKNDIYIPLGKRHADLPWRKEYEKLLNEHNAAVKRGEIERDEHGNAKLERTLPIIFVLEFMKFARNQEDIWDAILERDYRIKNEPGFKDRKEWKDYAHYLAQFERWYIWKDNLKHGSGPYAWGTGALCEIATGDLPDDLDSHEVREFLLKINSIVETH